MVKYFSSALFAGILMLAVSSEAKQLPDFTEIVKANSAAVVKINSVRKPSQAKVPEAYRNQEVPEIFRRLFEQQQRPQNRGGQSLGSGFVISADGYLLTNNHVIADADEVTVLLQDQREFTATVVGTDERSDLALLKVDADDLPVVKIGDSTQLDVGEWVLAIGSPFGLDYSVAAGIVSAKGRSLPTERGENYVPFIQTDVAINPGNSGGPLFNMDGEVVGINSQIYTRSGGSIGLSFAIPVSVAMEVVEQLKSNGHVVRGWLGVGIQDVSKDLAKSFGMKKAHGALISQIVDDGPAAKGDIEVGDVILSFDGKKIRESSDLPHVVGRTKAESTVDVLVFRNGKEKSLRIKVGSLDAVDGPKAASANDKKDAGGRLGLLVEPLSDSLKSQFKVESGVIVAKVAPSGAAAASGLRRGDVITSIDNKKIDGLSAFNKVVKKLPAKRHVAVRIVRRGQPGFVAIKVED